MTPGARGSPLIAKIAMSGAPALILELRHYRHDRRRELRLTQLPAALSNSMVNRAIRT